MSREYRHIYKFKHCDAQITRVKGEQMSAIKRS